MVCDGATTKLPRIFPGMMNRMFMPFEDPAQFVGKSAATLEEFREVRDEIEPRLAEMAKDSTRIERT